MPESYQKARRAHSLPSPRYMIPSAEMGEYENPDGRRRSAPAGPTTLSRQHSHLYPLDEEGTYGRLPRSAPRAPAAAPATNSSISRRERKPKVYSSYSVDSNCSLHQKRKSSIPPSRKTSSSSTGSRSSSTPGGRRRQDSLSPDRGFVSGSNGSRSSISPEPNRRRSSSAVSGYSTSTTTVNGQERHTYSSYSRSTKGEQSFQETEEYSGGGNKVGGGLSLDKMRMPKFDTWDSMGILGLTSKMWADTKKRQESFMESTGHFLREERDSYIM